jgi:hypothetical protein
LSVDGLKGGSRYCIEVRAAAAGVRQRAALCSQETMALRFPRRAATRLWPGVEAALRVAAATLTVAGMAIAAVALATLAVAVMIVTGLAAQAPPP